MSWTCETLRGQKLTVGEMESCEILLCVGEQRENRKFMGTVLEDFTLNVIIYFAGLSCLIWD